MLDVGAGDGRAVDFFNSLDAAIEYHGVDIQDSDEALRFKREDVEVVAFDGIDISFGEASFDLTTPRRSASGPC